MHIKRFLSLGLASVAVLSLFAGCGKAQTQNGVPITAQAASAQRTDLVMAIGSEPDGGFDPCIGWGRYGNPLFQSTLVDTDPAMNIVNDLATGYTISEDGLTWTFSLREDASFTDGEPVTAEDVVFTYRTAQVSGSIVDLTAMDSISAADDHTVVFRLKKPQSAFIYTIAATGIVPAHAYGTGYGDNPIGSGPFKLVQWDKGQQIIMAANESYYGKVPEIKKITVLFMSEDAAFAAAKAGQLDVAMSTVNLTGQNIDGMTLRSFDTIDNRGLTLPYLKDEGKTDAAGNPIGNNVTFDPAVRRALSYGLDREALVRDVLGGYGRPAYTECDNMPWWNEETVVAYDAEKAKQILTDAGWIDGADGIRVKDGVRAEFNLLYGAGDSTRQALSMAVAQQSKTLGISINVQGASWDEIDRRMYTDAVLMGWGAQNPTETYLLYHKDNMGRDYYNPAYYNNPTVDRNIEQAMSALTVEESMEYWKKAQWDGETGLATQGDCAWVWLTNIDHLYYVRDGLDVGEQKIHPHGHAWPLVANLKDWKWNES